MAGGLIFGAIFIGGFVLIIVFLVLGRKRQSMWAKKQAKHMIESGKVDTKTVEKVLQVLAEVRQSNTNDVEARNLFGKLSDLNHKQE